MSLDGLGLTRQDIFGLNILVLSQGVRSRVAVKGVSVDGLGLTRQSLVILDVLVLV